MAGANLDPPSDVARTLGLGQSAGKGRHVKRWLTWGTLAVIMAIVVIVIRWSTEHGSDTLQFKTEEARRGDLTVTVTATGTLEPTNQVDVGSELSGTVESVAVDYNDRVKVGQILASLDISKFEAQFQQSKAALESARAKVLAAQATVKEAANELARLERVRKLSDNKVPSEHDLHAAEAALQRAQADEAGAKAAVAEAQATLEAYESDLGKTAIRSPVDGIVLKRGVEPGQTVAASLQAPVLFTLAEDLAQMELHVDVDEADVGEVTGGQEATFTVDAYPDRTYPARITQVRYGPETLEGVVTYETVLNVDNADLSLRPGMTATADIMVRKVANVILVPNSALRFVPPAAQEEKSPSGGILNTLLPHPPRSSPKRSEGENAKEKQRRVWMLRGRQPVAIPVTTGSTDGIMTEVISGDVEPGMALVVDAISTGR